MDELINKREAVLLLLVTAVRTIYGAGMSSGSAELRAKAYGLRAAADILDEMPAVDAVELERDPWISVAERLPEIQEGRCVSRDVFVTDGENICAAFQWLEYDNTTSWSYTGMGPITHWCEKIFLLPSHDTHREEAGKCG